MRYIYFCLTLLCVDVVESVYIIQLERAKCVMTDYYAFSNSLNGNMIGCEGVIALASSLRQCRDLEQLEWVSSYATAKITIGNLWCEGECFMCWLFAQGILSNAANKGSLDVLWEQYSVKAKTHQVSNPGQPWLELPVLCHNSWTTTNPHNPSNLWVFFHDRKNFPVNP